MRTKQATGRWLALVLALCALSGCDVQSANADPSGAPYSTSPPASDVVGDLGGVPVSIPRAYARLVEYEGDPHWLEKRKGPPPVRTFGSKLTSFGIVAHYPDMKPLSKENYESYRKTKFRDSEWIHMGVLAGSSLIFRDDPLERPYESLVPGHEPHVSNTYERLPAIYGLTPYKAVKDLGIDLVLDEENRNHSGLNHVLYFYRDDSGKIATFIKCSSGLRCWSSMRTRTGAPTWSAK